MLASLPFLKLHGRHEKVTVISMVLNRCILLEEWLHDFLLYEEKEVGIQITDTSQYALPVFPLHCLAALSCCQDTDNGNGIPMSLLEYMLGRDYAGYY